MEVQGISELVGQLDAVLTIERAEMSLTNCTVENLLFRRPRLLNILHSVKLANATSQTIPAELEVLERYATGAQCALEIGTYQGVSAGRIANALATGGLLYCVDPWPRPDGGENPCWSICRRHLRRSGVENRIRFLRGYSRDLAKTIPDGLDFAFVDGDHSWGGIDTDWRIVADKVISNGVICLHDALVPPGQEWRRLESCRYFESVIVPDPRFSVLETIHSLAVLQKDK